MPAATRVFANDNCRRERKRKPCASLAPSPELEQGCRHAASLNEIGRRFCTPVRSRSHRLADGTREERSRHEEVDALSAGFCFSNAGSSSGGKGDGNAGSRSSKHHQVAAAAAADWWRQRARGSAASTGRAEVGRPNRAEAAARLST